MPSVVQVCNLALGRIGIDLFIEDIEDRNARAIACKQYFEGVRQSVLSDFPWNFATKVVQLAAVDVDVPGWGAAYRYPADCLTLRHVTPASGGRFQPPPLFGQAEAERATMIQGEVRFRVVMDPVTPEARVILSDLDDAWAWYTADVPSPALWPQLFVEALAWKLAAELSGPLRVEARLRQYAEQTYLWALSQAQAGSLNEEYPDPYPDSPSVAVRA